MKKTASSSAFGRELQEACRLFQQSFESAPFRAYAKDREHRFFYGNKETRKAHGATDILRSTDADFFSDEFARFARKKEKALLSGRAKTSHGRDFEPWRDGRLTFVEYFKHAIRNEKGKIIGLFGISREVADFSRSEFSDAARLKESGKGEGYFYRILTKGRKGSDRVWFSDGFKRIYGWTGAHPSRDLRRGLIHPKDIKRVKSQLKRCYAGEIPVYDCDFRMKNAQGNYVWIKAYGRVVHREKSGRQIHFAGYHRDITETTDREQVMDVILNRFEGYIFAKDAEKTFKFANAKLLDDLKLKTLDQIKGKKDRDFFPADEVKAFEEADQKILDGVPEVFRLESVTRRRDKKVDELFTMKFPMTGPFRSRGKKQDGSGILGIATKVSPFLSGLGDRELLWRCLMEDESDVIYVKDVKGYYLQVNQGFTKHTGVTQEQVRKQRVSSYKVLEKIAPDLVKEIRAEDRYIIKHGRPRNPKGTTRKVKDQDHRMRTGLSRKWPIKNKKGKVVKILGISRDISFMERLAEEAKRLENVQQVLKEQSEAKGIVDKHMDSLLLRTLKKRIIEEKEAALELETKWLTICFCDIRGFSELASDLKHKPRMLMEFLKKYYSLVVEVAHAHEAVVDKFLGDGAMILFGVTEQSDPSCQAENAARMAIGLSKRFEMLSNEWCATVAKDEGNQFQMELGIGIHAGEVLVGYVKGEERDQYTAIGHVVNLAQRIESKAGKEIRDEEHAEVMRRKVKLPMNYDRHMRDRILLSLPVHDRLQGRNRDLAERFGENLPVTDARNIKGTFRVFGLGSLDREADRIGSLFDWTEQ